MAGLLVLVWLGSGMLSGGEDRPEPTPAVDRALETLRERPKSPCRAARTVARAGYWPGLIELARNLPLEGAPPKCLRRAIDALEPAIHLVALLDDASATRRLDALALIASAPDAAFRPALDKALADAEARVRLGAVRVARRHPVKLERQAMLAGALRGDAAPAVRRAAAEAIGTQANRWAVDTLEAALKVEPDASVKNGIQRALRVAKQGL